MMRSPIGRGRLFGFGRAALSVLPSMVAKFGGLVIICAAFLIAFAVITGIAGDMIGAIRAEIAEWRYKAEGEAAAARTDSIIKTQTNKIALVPIAPNERAYMAAPLLAVPVETLRKTGEAAFAAFVPVDQLPVFMTQFMGIVERTAGADGMFSKDEAIGLTRLPGTTETPKLVALLNTFQIGAAGTQARRNAVDVALQLDEMEIGLSTE